MKTKFCILLSLFVLLFFVTCDPPFPAGAGNIRIITEDVTAVTTWSHDYVYVIEKYDFYVMNTLTIEAGTVIKFHPSLGPYMMLGGAGVINATGTALNPIVFTSYRDDANGGDTNGDGAGTSPARRDWGYVNTNGCNGSIFRYCDFFYSGAVNYRQALSVEAGSIATVQYCVFAHNDGLDGANFGGALDAHDAGAGTVIQNNTFFDNVVPLTVAKLYSLNDTNTFHNPDNISQTNTYNAIFVEDSNDFTVNITWSETEVAFVMPPINEYWVVNGITLTLGNDVVLKSKSGGSLMIRASGNISNYNGTGVAFTSYLDDTRKGDSNGDGSATSPAAGNWLGIYNDGTSVWMTWANIFYDSH
jgi:hypothetical protein